tara:strand:+ start:2869 stop:3018 length:150 start_codon:yes stop_codon:yes gene_type:complete
MSLDEIEKRRDKITRAMISMPPAPSKPKPKKLPSRPKVEKVKSGKKPAK